VERDLVANDRELEGGVIARPRDGYPDRRALRSAQALDRIVDAHPPRVFVLDGTDHVTCSDSERVRGRPFERGYDRDVAVHGLDGDAQAVVRALLPFLKL
jgi:hypothetical protein